MTAIGRNDPCPCGSGKKYKKCCGRDESGAAAAAEPAGANVPRWFQTAFAHHQAGRLDEAKALYQQILRVEPKQADSLHLLGLVAHRQGDLERAVELIERSIAVAPGIPQAHYNLGVVLQEQGELEKAAAAYRQAIALDANYADAHYNLGNVLRGQHRVAEAAASYERAIALNPNDPAPRDNLGTVLHMQGKLDEAVASYERAIALNPNDAETYNNLGGALHDLGRLPEAVQSYRRALSIDPDSAKTHSNLGAAYFSQSLAAEAVASCEKAIALDPALSTAHCNRGIALCLLGRLDESADAFGRALTLDPEYVEARGNLLFIHNYRLNVPADQMLAEAREYGRRVTAQATRPYSTWVGSAEPDRRLRVGFVSADFCDHPVGYFLEAVLAALGGRSLELVAYPTHLRNDSVAARIRTRFSAWHPIVGMDDEEAAKRIHDDAIDILIDLSGHTAGNRLPVFAWRPAPIQATWLGYFATTGVDEIDYLIADPWTVPPSEEANFTETIWRLPETRLCFTPPDADVAVAPLPARATSLVTFGCFNNVAKLNDAVVALWGRVLEAVPGSRLLLKAHQLAEDATIQLMRDRFAAHGIVGERLALERPSARADYLASYANVDIALDPFPFPGGTTTVEALWMGVPALTLAGERMIARQGVSLLMNAGLDDWVACDEDDYVAKAKSHAADLAQLALLREGLRARLERSPVLDANRFADHFEAALRGMWRASLQPH